MMLAHVHPGDVEAFKARLGPAVLRATAGVASAEADAIARQWGAYAARRASWATAHEDLEDGRDLAARLELLTGERVGQAAAEAPPQPQAHGVVTPGDVLAYRSMWDDYVTGTARAALTCADAWDAAAAGSSPATPIAVDPFVAAPPDATTLRLWAQSERLNAASIMSDWNAHADSPDWVILSQAGNILLDFQRVVLKVGNVYQPQISRECPKIELPSPPTLDVQKQVIARVEGLNIVAHGALQLIGIGTGGGLETLGAIGGVVASTAKGLASGLTWVVVGAIGMVVVLFARGK